MGRVHAGVQCGRADRYGAGLGDDDTVSEGVWPFVEDEARGGGVDDGVDEGCGRGEDVLESAW